MRVLVVTVVHHPLDARVYARQVRALVDAGHTVTYAAPWSSHGVEVPPDVTAVDLPRAAGRRRLRAWWAARRVIASSRHHHVVLLHNPELVLPALTVRHRPPTVWDVHEDPAASLIDKPYVPRPVRSLLAHALGAVEALAERRLHLLLAEEGYRPRFQREHPVVPNEPIVPPTGTPPGDDRVVYLGRVSPGRGAEELLELPRHLPDGVLLEILGWAEPEVEDRLRAAARSGELSWRGRLDNDAALERVDGSLAGLSLLHDLPNYRHSRPTKVVEYMAREVPVVTTPLPVAAAIVERHRAGIVVPFEDVAATADAVRRLRDDPDERRRMGAAGHHAALAHYNWARSGRRFVEVLEAWATPFAVGDQTSVSEARVAKEPTELGSLGDTMGRFDRWRPAVLARRGRRRWYRRHLPHDAYVAGGAALRPAGSGFRYVVTSPRIDGMDVYRENATRVLGHLEAIGAEHLVLRSRFGEQPALAIRRRAVPGLLERLRADAATTPLYVRWSAAGMRRTDRLLVSDAELDPAEIDELAVYQHLVDGASGRRYGTDFAVELHCWSDDELDAGDDAPLVPADVYGTRGTTRHPHDVPEPTTVGFPIDVVYLWVDGSDPVWRARRAERLAAAGRRHAAEAATEARFQQFDELRYSLRSVARFAPWVRHVYVVTDRQRPPWLLENDRLRVVDHTEILPADALPTFNSHAIVAAVHRIPDLSDRFLLVNDDIALGRPVGPERFFLANGTTKFFLSRSRLTPTTQVAHQSARVHTSDLIERHTGVRPAHVMRHTPVALNRELLAELAERFAPQWEATLRTPFRSATDIVPSWLHHWVGFTEGRCAIGTLRYGYLGVDDQTTERELQAFGAGRPPDAFCVNDLGGTPPDRARVLAEFFERQLPIPSPWEHEPDRPAPMEPPVAKSEHQLRS